MDRRTIRSVIIDGLEAGAISFATRIGFRGPFLDGAIDVELEKLGMDSLARMELCIAIEVGTGVSLAPEQLDAFPTLGALVVGVEERMHA